MFLLDFLWAIYTKAVATGDAFKAAATASILYALAAYVMVSIVGDYWVLLPACAGSFIGTYFGVKHGASETSFSKS